MPTAGYDAGVCMCVYVCMYIHAIVPSCVYLKMFCCFLFLHLFCFMSVSVLLCVCNHTMSMQCPWRSEGGIGALGTTVLDDCEPQRGCWELESEAPARSGSVADLGAISSPILTLLGYIGQCLKIQHRQMTFCTWRESGPRPKGTLYP